MNALEYARRFIYFWQSSPISGPFNEEKYKFLVDPLLSLDDILCKCNVVYGPTQSVKTVLLQIATAYRLDVVRKSVLAVAQTDDDAKEFAQIKLRPFLERIPSLVKTVRNMRHAITDSHWLWPTHELIISGPGENAQQSKSVCFNHTDEAHRWNEEYPGALASLDNRMGGRWDRNALHCTTAAKAGTEIDILYHRGRQNEWNLMCPKCHGFFRPLWEDHSREIYNGHKVFVWIDSQSERETLDSIEMRCPHCDGQILDLPRNRVEMDEGAHYIAENPNADAMFNSFRWNAFAPRWKAWKDLLAIYLSALQSAKLGDISKYKDWVTKQEVRTDTGEFPMMGNSTAGRDYKKSDVQIVDCNATRTLSIDRQQGRGGKGFHLWALVEEWQRDGKSKRVEYKELESFTAAKKMQIDFNVPKHNVAVDCGDQVERDVFGACATFRWYALKSGDEIEFPHRILNRDKTVSIVNRPWSEPRLEDAMVGRKIDRQIRNMPGRVPPGHCLSILWSKPSIYPILYALKNGDAGRYYGIASDFNPEFIKQLHSYIPGDDVDKKTGTIRKILWQKIAKDDHGFICAAQGLILAIRAGFYPMGFEENK